MGGAKEPMQRNCQILMYVLMQVMFVLTFSSTTQVLFETSAVAPSNLFMQTRRHFLLIIKLYLGRELSKH